MLPQRFSQEISSSALSKADGCEDETPRRPIARRLTCNRACKDSGAVNNGRLDQKLSMVVSQVLSCATAILAALPAKGRPPSASECAGGINSYREPHHTAAPAMSLNNVYQNVFTRHLHNRRWSAAFYHPPEVLFLKFLYSSPGFFFHSPSTHNNLSREPEPQPSGWPSSLLNNSWRRQF